MHVSILEAAPSSSSFLNRRAEHRNGRHAVILLRVWRKDDVFSPLVIGRSEERNIFRTTIRGLLVLNFGKCLFIFDHVIKTIGKMDPASERANVKEVISLMPPCVREETE